VPGRLDHVIVGSSYWPASSGPYMWHERIGTGVAADLAAVRNAGLEAVRLHLAWDAFMPSDRQVSPHRLRDLAAVLEAARAVSLGVVPVLFAQSFGDCVFLPAYAVDKRRPRPGVRVICDQNIVTGGPRDLYADPLMLEAATRWLDGLLSAFANHPAVVAWDLGHDPASTVRPRRTAEMAAWVELMSARIRGHEDACWLTLGAGDVLTARGVRLAAVAGHVDALGLHVDVHRVAAALRAAPGAGPVVFTAQLAQRLASGAQRAGTPLLVNCAIASGEEAAPPRPGAEEAPAAWDVPLLEPARAAALAADLVDRLGEVGVAGLLGGSWQDTAARTLIAAPFDRFPSIARWGLAAMTGELKPWGEAWAAAANRASGLAAPVPWPDELDVAGYYASLPDSALDLYAAWSKDEGTDDAVSE
jgi:hypothetical protein